MSGYAAIKELYVARQEPGTASTAHKRAGGIRTPVPAAVFEHEIWIIKVVTYKEPAAHN
jgi:hypothetical protein